MQDEKGDTLSFIYDDEAKDYTPYDEEGETSRKGKYYIALASNPYYVIGINGTGDGALPILQNRTGNINQLFEIQQEGDVYSFRNMAGGKWLDLAGGNVGDGAKVHVWSNEYPNENQKWYVTECDGGVHISPFRDRYTWCLDLNGANAQENQKIHLWSANNTPAQKWVLIPAGNTAETQTDLNVSNEGTLTINNLKPGNYTISEIKAPTGHSLLRDPIRFCVNGDGSVTLSNGSGMSSVDDKITLKIRNEKLYKLPEAGGIGTYWYTISGTLLMLVGVLILYKKKYAGRC